MMRTSSPAPTRILSPLSSFGTLDFGRILALADTSMSCGGYSIALMRPAPMAGRCFNMKMLDGLLECCGQAWTFCLTPA